MSMEKTLVEVQKSISSIETNIRMMTDYQRETNESIRDDVKNITKDVDDLKAIKNRFIGVGMAGGFFGGLIGFLVSFIYKQ